MTNYCVEGSIQYVLYKSVKLLVLMFYDICTVKNLFIFNKYNMFCVMGKAKMLTNLVN